MMGRRGAIRLLGGGSLGLGLAGSPMARAEGAEPARSGRLKITIAGYKLDRVAGLIDGRVKVDGCDSQFEIANIGEMNTHAFSGPQTREVTEIGLSPYMHAFANDGFRDYSLIPVFPLRVFRHKSIFIRSDRGIAKPADLRGKKIGAAGYSSTSLTWIRGILQHEYGVGPEDVKWIISSKDSSAKESGIQSKQESLLPEGLDITSGPDGKDESAMLADGDVDAVFHAAEPKCFIEGHPLVTRLFADSKGTEQAYYKNTGIFPIMHAVAIRRDLADARPGFTKAVFDAYSASKQLAYQRLQRAAWYQDALPWVSQEFESTRALMGNNYWAYGIGPNRKALEALFQYSHEQGLASRRLEIEELFHPSTLDLVEERS